MTSQFGDETIKDVIELGLLDKYKDKYPELFEYAERLSGLPKSFSAHPCGKVVSMENDIDYYNAIDMYLSYQMIQIERCQKYNRF